MRKRLVLTLALLAVVAGTAMLACADTKPLEERVTRVEGDVASLGRDVAKIDAQTSAPVPPRNVEFFVTAVEWKGSTSIDSLSAPTTDPATLSAGYRYKAPGVADKSDAKKWEVSAYVYTPGAMTVYQGDTVTLRIFAVNGDSHGTSVLAPNGATVVQETVNRGREDILVFKADQTGIYRLLCADHAPTMQALITVLPRT